MSRESIIEVENLTKRFGRFTANDNLTFEVREGEVFGFLGANGAGKTTALRILCGLSKPTSGTVRIAGLDASHHPDRIKKVIGYMCQRFALYEDLTVFENIQLYGGIYGLTPREIRSRSDELLDKLSITDLRNRLIRSVPLGWRQKLAFSIAVLHRPKIVFLDEPTGGVDPIARRQFWDLIYDAARSGMTVFVTTHYMDEAEYCDRVCILSGGRIEALGRPEDLKTTCQVDTMDEVFIRIARKDQT
ncbi:MAG: ABC transporter ATP-binding protein [Bacteroidales bacterium]|jgi:ABC-2 type transport system ATP-binding protein|nr:ABC transporter ATP-binding protein [Bacteroidales bacterium]MDD2570086.1 ABC transporter ATP-binding protein [Bacteroidales bacterium]MDD3812550.1 ABC transporter ATP-binding protein [Bacteroidales bacterium]MDD4812123.1 ABC transporter ATP-binding protein [Bacteroidales bacterium]NLO69117.1 ABC transporter ATP-binding protein [Bacteroidales bacterium]